MVKKIVIDTQVIPEQAENLWGDLCDVNDITATIKCDDIVVWSDTVGTDDSIESVCSVRESQYRKAMEVAKARYGYLPDEIDYGAAGYLLAAA
ncbi:MAG: hypothetical protein RI996_551 [Candidatus Parcubacteria bacterium]|jgi:hypothetical protein